MLRTNEETKFRIRQRIEEIDDYVLNHRLLFNPFVEDLWREKRVLCKRLMML